MQLERTFFRGRHRLEEQEISDLHRSLNDFSFMCFPDRKLQRLDTTETRHRNEGALAEVQHRDEIRLAMNSEHRAFDREWQAMWDAYFAELLLLCFSGGIFFFSLSWPLSARQQHLLCFWGGIFFFSLSCPLAARQQHLLCFWGGIFFFSLSWPLSAAMLPSGTLEVLPPNCSIAPQP